MGEFGVLILLYGAAVLLLVAEIFIPSHGVLSVTGVGFLVAAVVKTFDYYGDAVGYMAAIVAPVFLLVFAIVAAGNDSRFHNRWVSDDNEQAASGCQSPHETRVHARH